MAKTTKFRVLPGNAWQRGMTKTEQGYNFAVAVPDEADAELLLYENPEQSRPCQTIPLPKEDRIGDVSAVMVEMPHDSGYGYAYRIAGQIRPDRYAGNLRDCIVKKGSYPELHALLDTQACASTKPLRIPYEDAVIYKAHVRGLTMKKPKGVKHPGTFRGIVEFIPYLKEMGINMLMLMPSYEFEEQPPAPGREYSLDGDLRILAAGKDETRKNYWGYVPGMYFAPKIHYSADEDPCREFAGMVDALHEAGIGCIPEFYFREAEDPRFVTDVLRHWLVQYHVDGFHLVGSGNWVHTVCSDPLLKRTWILYSGFGEQTISNRRRKNGERTLGLCNQSFEQTMRRFLKGDQEVSIEDAGWMLRRNDPNCGIINYFADQDGFTMADMVMYSERHNEANGEQNRDGCAQNNSWNCGEEGPSRKAAIRKLREQQIRNAWLMLLTAQGTPMLYAGDEVMNTQGGNNNAWCQDNETGWVTWKKTAEVLRMEEFVKKAVAFRKAHPVLHQKNPLRIADYKAAGFPDISYHTQTAWMSQGSQTKSGMGVLFCGEYGRTETGEADDTLYLVYNMYWKQQSFALPDLPAGTNWMITADTSKPEGFFEQMQQLPENEEGGKVLQVPARCVMILTAVPEEGKKTCTPSNT